MPTPDTTTASEAVKQDLDARKARINNHLAYLSDQCSKQHYFNAMHGVARLIEDMMRDFRDALNPESARHSPIPGSTPPPPQAREGDWRSKCKVWIDHGLWCVDSPTGSHWLDHEKYQWNEYTGGELEGNMLTEAEARAALAKAPPPPDAHPAQTREGDWQTTDTMPTIDGKSFRCDCRCNVFRRHTREPKYKCNACGAVYAGDPVSPPPPDAQTPRRGEGEAKMVPLCIQALRMYVEENGPMRVAGCPQDDTCNCAHRWINEAVNWLCQHPERILGPKEEQTPTPPSPASGVKRYQPRRDDPTQHPYMTEDTSGAFVSWNDHHVTVCDLRAEIDRLTKSLAEKDREIEESKKMIAYLQKANSDLRNSGQF